MTVHTDRSLMDLHPRELKGMVEAIPTLPAAYRRLFARMQDPDVGVPEIAELIQLDRTLSARALHLVNSAFSGYAKQINTVSRAVVILGFQAVRSAALAISVFDFFRDERSTETVDMRRFWEHSIAVAAISKVLADTNLRNLQEDAFVVGLLHDIGKLIEKRYFPEDFDEAVSAAQQQHLSWYDCEKQLFGLNHAAIGGTLFRTWSFPPSVVEAVRHHHTPESATTHGQLASLAHVADVLSYELGYGAPGAFPPPAPDASALKLLHAEPDRLLAHPDRAAEEIGHALEILEIIE